MEDTKGNVICSCLCLVLSKVSDKYSVKCKFKTLGFTQNSKGLNLPLISKGKKKFECS